MTFISWLAISIAFFLLAAIAFFGAISMKRVWLMIACTVFILAGITTGGLAVFRFSTSVSKPERGESSKRTAEEVFAAELSRPVTKCVQIVDFQDDVTTSGGEEMDLCFTACPAEAARVLGQRPYEVVVIATRVAAEQVGKGCSASFLIPERFGDSVLAGRAAEGLATYHLYISRDSSRICYRKHKQ